MKQKRKSYVFTTIVCRIYPGMFSGERGVQFELPDGRTVSAFVDKSRVIVEREPTSGSDVQGRLKVDVLQYEDDSAIVDLSQPAVTVGQRIRVPRSFIEEVSV